MVPVYVPFASWLTTEELKDIVALSEALPETPFLMPGIVSPDGATNQFPPLLVEAVAVHASAEAGAPVFVTLTFAVATFDELRETLPGLTFMFASGVQRIMNAAEGLVDARVCVGEGETDLKE
jgi:hypothetical protein